MTREAPGTMHRSFNTRGRIPSPDAGTVSIVGSKRAAIWSHRSRRPTATALTLLVSVAFLLPQAIAQAGEPPVFSFDGGRVKVGEEQRVQIATPHPVPAAPQAEPIWQDVILWPEASYIAVHFSRFDLAPGEKVVVHTPDKSHSYTFTGRGKPLAPGTFWATHVPGDTCILSYYAGSGIPGFGYEIDRFAHGFPRAAAPAIEALCGQDDSEWAKCYQSSEPQIYDKGRAIARLMINGSSACTGWLLGCEGHVMTNNHCIGNQSDASNTDFEFMAEGSNCTTNCASWGGCPGTVAASTSTLIKTSGPMDYSLVLLPSNVSGTYGYMKLRPGGAIVDERIYIPQHPQAWGKKIAVFSTDSHDQSGFAEVFSKNEPACQGGGPPDVGYYADTQGGSSGSPVLAYSDHQVVALHHCANCPNRGVPIESIITNLGGSLPNCSTCTTPGIPSSLTATPNGNNRIDLGWSNGSPAAATSNIYRSTSGCSGFTLLQSGITATSFSDTTVSGGVQYSYVVTGVDSTGGCESGQSNCAQATGTGPCVSPPTFAGLQSVTSAGTSTCRLQLTWNAASLNCGTSVVYNVSTAAPSRASRPAHRTCSLPACLVPATPIPAL